MNAVDLLQERAREYELRAASDDERTPLDPSKGQTAIAWAVVAIVLREVALALEAEREAA